jgi:hypothetical protein
VGRGRGSPSPHERREHSMSAEEFDALTRGLASRAISRRRALQLAAASALGAAGLGVATEAAEAAPPPPTCPRGKKPACNLRCRHSSAQGGCACIRTTEGKKACVYPCCSPRTCNSSSDCRKSEVCLKTDCCGGASVCVTRCTAQRPGYCDTQASASTASDSTTWS